MDDITRSLRLSSNHALQSGKIASTSARDTEEGGRAVHQLVKAIRKIVDKISINTAIQQLHDVIQQNASASEEFSATAEELSGQACQLRDTVRFFRTSEGQSAFSV